MWRNAHDLLAWHERLVLILEQALLPFGFGHIFAKATDRRGRIEVRSSKEDLAMDRLDEAVSIVMDIFAREVSV